MPPKIVNPESLPATRGYNHGILSTGGRILFIAGQTGLDENGRGDFAAQFGRALAAVRLVVEEAGGATENIGRLTIYVKDMQVYLRARRDLNNMYRKHFGRHYPAMSVIEVNGFIQPEMEVEIEATAVLQD